MCVKHNSSRDYWYIDTSWPDGLRTRTRQPDQVTANKLNKKIEVAIVDEDRIWKKLRKELRLEGGTLQGLSQFADLYFEQWVIVHNRSLRSKKSRLNIVKRHFGATPVDAINIQNVDGFISARRGAGVSNQTINRDLAVMSHMFEWAVKRGYLEANPMSKLERLEEIEWVGRRPDDSVINAVFERLDRRVLPIFTFIRETGCRRGEAIALKRSQIDFARAQVIFHSITKNGRQRQVPLTESALCAISAMPKLRDHVFYHPDSLRVWTGDSLATFWERARSAAGFPWLRIHDLRHAYGIGLAEAGAAMHFISEVLGHHSIDFTREHYAKFSPDSASRAVLKVLQGRKAAAAPEG